MRIVFKRIKHGKQPGGHADMTKTRQPRRVSVKSGRGRRLHFPFGLPIEWDAEYVPYCLSPLSHIYS